MNQSKNVGVCDFRDKTCKPCEGGVPPMSDQEVVQALKQIPGWTLNGKMIERKFMFNDYHQTMAFVNATAWVSHLQNHHPDLVVAYDHCIVTYITHAIDGLSENDFICAAKINALL